MPWIGNWHSFFLIVTIQTQWCDQHMRVIQFVEKLPNEYQTTLCTECKKPQQKAGKLSLPKYTFRWSFQTEDWKPWNLLGGKPDYEIILERDQKLSTKTRKLWPNSAFLRRLHEALYRFICLHVASAESLTTAKGSCRTSRESYEPKMRWKIPLTRWKLFPHDSIIPFFSLKAFYVPGTCLFSILGVDSSKRRSFRVQL